VNSPVTDCGGSNRILKMTIPGLLTLRPHLPGLKPKTISIQGVFERMPGHKDRKQKISQDPRMSHSRTSKPCTLTTAALKRYRLRVSSSQWFRMQSWMTHTATSVLTLCPVSAIHPQSPLSLTIQTCGFPSGYHKRISRDVQSRDCRNAR
jgi:hypothetical protein